MSQRQYYKDTNCNDAVIHFFSDLPFDLDLQGLYMKILRRLKSPGATAAELLDIHDRQVRAVLGLNEHVQRSAFHIYLGETMNLMTKH